METKLLRIIRANFDVRHPDGRWFAWKKNSEESPLFAFTAFDLVVKMLECIYPQGRHYAIMRHSRRFKQARRKDVVRIIEIACIVGFVSLIIIAILNSCCGIGIQC